MSTVAATAPVVWSPNRERADYDRWIAAVPRQDRERVRAFVERCGAEGRTEFWDAMTPTTDAHAAKALRSAALDSAKATMPSCWRCERHAVAQNTDAVWLCAEHVTPGDHLAIDLRGRR